MAVARVAFIPRRAANPEAASLFLGYLLSPEGQVAIGEAGLFPIHGKHERPIGPVPLDESFLQLLDPVFRASVLARWRAALGRAQDQNQNQDRNRRKQA
jgi:iron(III) transport system substrate-binding protein